LSKLDRSIGSGIVGVQSDADGMQPICENFHEDPRELAPGSVDVVGPVQAHEMPRQTNGSDIRNCQRSGYPDQTPARPLNTQFARFQQQGTGNAALAGPPPIRSAAAPGSLHVSGDQQRPRPSAFCGAMSRPIVRRADRGMMLDPRKERLAQ